MSSKHLLHGTLLPEQALLGVPLPEGRSMMSKPAPRNSEPDLYHEDFFAWTQEQAGLLRERRFAELDLANLVEEVEGVGRSEKAAIESRLDVLLAHLLKWKYQPGARSSSWRGTITEQRTRIARLLRDSPSLREYPAEIFPESYLSSRLLAAKETGIDFTLFPEVPPFSLEQALDDMFWPTEPDLLDRP